MSDRKKISCIQIFRWISKGQGADPEKGHFSVLLDFQKRHVLGTL
jgi:hypothetical protein